MKRTEFTQAWLDALRSGEYKQGAGALEREGRFCCLGVAAKVAGISTDETIGNYASIKGAFGVSILEQDALTHCNDDMELNFEQIADKIELMLEPEACQ